MRKNNTYMWFNMALWIKVNFLLTEINIFEGLKK